LSSFAGEYRVLRVVDGDTIDIDYNGTKERVRLLCVDTPESVHPDQSKNTAMGRKASDYSKKRLSGKSVDIELETKTRGKYGRFWPM
jgi:micrococcal nuclease